MSDFPTTAQQDVQQLIHTVRACPMEEAEQHVRDLIDRVISVTAKVRSETKQKHDKEIADLTYLYVERGKAMDDLRIRLNDIERRRAPSRRQQS